MGTASTGSQFELPVVFAGWLNGLAEDARDAAVSAALEPRVAGDENARRDLARAGARLSRLSGIKRAPTAPVSVRLATELLGRLGELDAQRIERADALVGALEADVPESLRGAAEATKSTPTAET